MLKSGILNPQINALLSRVRHTNTLVIADRGFPFWPQLETIDLSLIDDLPRVTDVLQAVLATWNCGQIVMADEFKSHNDAEATAKVSSLSGQIPILYQSHLDFKKRVPYAIGLIRTGDTTPYANMILESA